MRAIASFICSSFAFGRGIFSTIGAGLVYSLKNRGYDVANKKVLVLGCGTVAKSVVSSLVEEKALVTMYNKTLKTANEFVTPCD